MSHEKAYKEYLECFEDRNPVDYTLGDVLDIFTYDSELDAILCKCIVDVLTAIVERKTFEYQNTIDTRLNFVVVCHFPYIASRISWGTSIRGAWADGDKAEQEFKAIIEFYNKHHEL